MNGRISVQTVLSVKGLGKAFTRYAMRDISFDVRAGEIMAMLGPNGAGKSTTIRCIMGILVPDEGTIHFAGYPDNYIPKQKIGYLPEERGLYKNVQLLDLLLFFAELKDYPRKKARERAYWYLEKFDLKGKENSRIEELSKGMAQKVQFIASVIHEPELLVLDEPFSGLDPVSQEVFKKEILELAAQGTAILLSSHQMNLVEAICHRLLMIHGGKKVIEGPLEEVKRRYGNFKCTIRGQLDHRVLDRLPGVQSIQRDGDGTVLYLNDGVSPSQWLRYFPEELDFEEMTINRSSLHEIFLKVATGTKPEGVAGHAQ